MKTKVIIVFVIIILIVLSVCVITHYVQSSVVDKTGMIREFEDEIVIVTDTSSDKS